MPRTKAGKARSGAQLARDRLREGRLYLRGFTQVEIAEMIGVGKTTVYRDLKHLRRQWVKAALVDVGEVMGRELARLRMIELEAWEAWDRSTVLRGADGRPVIGDHGEEYLVPGDDVFLGRIQKVIQDRCKLFGLEAPTKVLLSGGLDVGGAAPLLSASERREALRGLLLGDLGVGEGDEGGNRQGLHEWQEE